MVSFLIDAVLAVMLVTATAYLVIVNRRLRVLQSGQSEINALITAFSRTIDETDASVKRMVASATEVSARLGDELERARTVKEDVTVLLDSVERTALRIEETVRHARSLARRLDSAPIRSQAAAAVPEPSSEPVSDPAEAAAAAAPPARPFVPPALTEEPMPAQTPAHQAPAPQTAPVPARTDIERGVSPTVGAFYARLRTVGTEA